MKNRAWFSLFSIPILLASAANSQRYVEHEISIPWVMAGPSGLDALLVYVDLPGKHPLVVITHGNAPSPEAQPLMNPWQQLPQALWFARRGWVALVVVRRGNGFSGGEDDTHHGARCPQTNYQQAGEYTAEDMRIAIDYARKLPQVDDTRILAAGVSAGGFATVALTAKAPPGLVAAINFAGGRGSQATHSACNMGDLVNAFRSFGKTSRIPMLWIYAENDKYFPPEQAQKFEAAFRSKGGQDQFVLAPAIGQNGHMLFNRVEAWSATVDDFLKAKKLAPLADLLPEPKPPNVMPPAGLSESGLQAFESYLLQGPHRAFATSEHFYGSSAANINVDLARRNALERCRHAADNKETCTVVYVDDTPVNP
ncbi:MAG: prolyl oligopeptidase family serine peptidase [Terracidiphilus sp.]